MMGMYIGRLERAKRKRNRGYFRICSLRYGSSSLCRVVAATSAANNMARQPEFRVVSSQSLFLAAHSSGTYLIGFVVTLMVK